jgi:Holliday junction resolvase RusA-like endonuclease
MSAYAFKVDLPGFEPMSLGTSGSGRHVKKGSLLEAIRSKAGNEELDKAKSAFKGKRVGVEVEFRLWKGDEHHPESVGRKDLDNLLKGVLDVLQVELDKQTKEKGLGLIEDDDWVFRILATKKIIEEPSNKGLTLTISALEP